MHMATETKPWTLEELHRLPDDGNKYELVRGELFVTPPPSEAHENILARLTPLLDPFVAANRLGMVYHPRSVMRFDGSEVEWDGAPTPVLIVEVLSGSTSRRDQLQKRDLYIDAGVEEYWIVDPERETIRTLRAGRADQTSTEQLTWSPSGAASSLTVNLRYVFGHADSN